MARVAGATILLTRPQADSQRFAAMLPHWPVVISPIMRIVPVPHDARRLRDAEGLVFTSAHAIPAAGPGRGRFAICVGSRTGDLARQAGFHVVEGNGFAESLPPLIAAAPVPLIHPQGRHLARQLPVEGVVVYDQQALDLSDQAQHLLGGDRPVILPIFSPRSARLLSAQVENSRAPLWPVAISKAAMEGWNAPARGRNIASEPSSGAMIAAIGRLHLTEH
ncbi:uroporphyrinogen-III synthase [Paracoccus fistulariae]|uniref:Uroporphyrinogen-III synthase n=1 Tax=Paracoccus fistulariae TaxID=658446 RepID=A0ABY7SNT9_9RHOB|nr:uroporphyrinogen-III synthase [Paracoccus fistulariae]MDB6182352.1 uroporphyrinogen-III synthase [Paracoccus fistulariae]WCR08670.1 uroporphyrinogen-III synthase [Paracoccus fistulariae]